MKKLVRICICALLIAAVVLPAAGTMNTKVSREARYINKYPSMEFVPGEFIVKLKKDATFSTSALSSLNEKHHVYALEKIFPHSEGTILDSIYLLHVPLGADIPSIISEYTSCPDVVYAEPNGKATPCDIPNDANFSNQWFLHNTGQVFLNYSGLLLSGKPDADIDAPEAWDLGQGSPEVVIAIIDSGIDPTHPELAGKLWNNTDEIPGNGLDDDHNGYIDDVHGWDLYHNTSNITDGNGHGTMCSGIAGAMTDNTLWGAGVARDCKIMPVRIADALWDNTWVGDCNGIKYAADNGADAVSMSWGGFTPPNILLDAVNYAYGKGVFLCAAAHNYDTSMKCYPAAYDNVTAVGATNQNDGRVTPADWPGGWGSNYGDWVDICAPGNIIFSTMPTYHVTFNDQGAKEYFDWGCGTSYATPQVAGVAALLLSEDPSLTPAEVKAFLCGNVDPYNSTEYIGTGRLNAQKALTAEQLSKGVSIKGGLGVKLTIANSGTANLKNITWQLHVDGGLYWNINKTKNGTIDLAAGQSTTFSTGLLLGLGSISITARIMGIEKKITGMQLFIFSKVK